MGGKWCEITAQVTEGFVQRGKLVRAPRRLQQCAVCGVGDWVFVVDTWDLNYMGNCKTTS